MNYKNKSWLEKKYWEEGLSQSEIGKLCNVSRKGIWKWMKKFNIKARKNYSEEIKQKQREVKIGEKNPNWNGGILINSNGYVLISMPDHPYSSCRGYIPRSRLIMEQHLGRYLEPEEVVHHENEIRHDDRIENFRLFENKGKHTSFHNRIRQSAKRCVI
ncbi:MAG: HNH endonuclease [candidate division Zixibacteria bacterium]|nr:HNH endonuclease [candidate division Zixibacteria bacterium]